ncbi:hypothetical protein GPJ56_004783 [Histomonas meleagridis]|uniref:uncharacterized protein n=1 Tax=Histomonas meleagridis TaxID=135588 RepID=UPI00355A75D8|nr:hypothetical protein GPJ56_004783 [Histomonas meleagridis]KAH0801681.1 hypothetical protein GO595_005516 [Histomonas meleagridis]
MSTQETEKQIEECNVSLEDLCEELVQLIGPNNEAIIRFRVKERQKCEPILIRLNEMLALVEEVAAVDQLGDPHQLTEKLNQIFESINCMLNFVQKVKGRLTLLEKETRRRKTNKILGKFFKKPQTPSVDLEKDVVFDTDKLMEECGISVPN